MKSKWLIASFLIIALMVVCGASLLSVWQGIEMVGDRGIHFNIDANTISAKETEDKSLTVNGRVTLNVDNPIGNVRVESGPAGEVTVTAEKTAWGTNDQKAQAALKALKVNIEQDGNNVTITVEQPIEVGVFSITPSGSMVKFTITVPEETDVILNSSNGDLSLRGTMGDANLQTSFGDIGVKDVKGKVTAQSSNGVLTGENIRSATEVSFSSDFGDITLNNVDGGAVSVSSTNGKLELNSVTASADIKLTTQFGSSHLAGGEAQDLEVQSNNGAVRLENVLLEGKVVVTSQFGDVSLDQVKASSFDLNCTNGKISMKGSGGDIIAHSDYGDVEVLDAENAQLDLSSDNGSITFSGSLGSGPQTIKSDFGNVSLTLPAESSMNLDLKTDFGKITSDFAIQISGELDAKHWQGVVNDGKIVLNIQTNNGNISLLQTTR